MVQIRGSGSATKWPGAQTLVLWLKKCNRAGNVKCCEHPETLAVRGLLLLGLGKTQEAEDSVKRGLKNNLR
jgi:hypothetical protein